MKVQVVARFSPQIVRLQLLWEVSPYPALILGGGGGCVICSIEFVISLVFESFMGHLVKTLSKRRAFITLDCI